MEKDDLIKKLEEVSLPEIEISSHKRKLKTALLAKYFPEKRKASAFDIFRKLAPVGVIALILLIFSLTNFFFPQSSLAKAKEIALRDPQIKKMIEKGAVIKQVEITNERAYVLIESAGTAPEKAMTPFFATEGAKTKQEALSVLAEINFPEKRVAKIDEITPSVVSFSEKEIAKTKEMAKKNLPKQDIVPQAAEVLQVKVLPSAVRLIKKDQTVELISEQPKEAAVIYEYEKQQWESKINLQSGEMRATQFLGKTLTP